MLVMSATIMSVAVAAAVPAAGAAPAPGTEAAPAPHVGYDVSYPQCPALGPPTTLPSPAPFTILGVNGGLAYSANPCLLQLYRWARGAATSDGGESDNQPEIALYANTGNPGPQLSPRWPRGQNFPRFCDGAWNVPCSYDYGWNAAGYAFALANATLPDGVATRSTWWLDVETANSWNPTDQATNVAALEGFRDRLSIEAPDQVVGFYSNQRQWGLITGATRSKSPINEPFDDAPNWVAGATGATARSFCGDTFTGAPVQYVQYVESGIDHNLRC
jgi:hypothetical protein